MRGAALLVYNAPGLALHAEQHPTHHTPDKTTPPRLHCAPPRAKLTAHPRPTVSDTPVCNAPRHQHNATHPWLRRTPQHAGRHRNWQHSACASQVQPRTPPQQPHSAMQCAPLAHIDRTRPHHTNTNKVWSTRPSTASSSTQSFLCAHLANGPYPNLQSTLRNRLRQPPSAAQCA